MTITPPLPTCTYRADRTGLERFMGPLEATIMAILWDARLPLSVKGVLRLVRDEYRGDIALTTVQTTIFRLHAKGYLERRKNGCSYYTPRETRAQFEQRQVARIMESLE